MIVRAVIGLGFGDEGKGVTTDSLVAESDNPIVVRYSGGQQAGHTVKIGDKKHVFSNFGSGTLRGAPTYWSKYCTVDPMGIVNEREDLIKLGLDPTLYIHPKAPVTTPYDKYANQINVEMVENGTCGLGVGTTYQREEDFYHLQFEDLFYPTVLKQKLEAIKYYHGYEIKGEPEKFLSDCKKVIQGRASLAPESEILEYDTIIFEGSQGLMLDQHNGFFPNVTRSNTGLTNILEMGFDPDEVFYVTRAYQTRHGNGPMTNIDREFYIEDDPRETNVTNTYQGEFRKSMLDASLLEYALMKDDYKSYMSYKYRLVVTCLDHLDEYKMSYHNSVLQKENPLGYIQLLSDILGINKVIGRNNPDSNVAWL